MLWLGRRQRSAAEFGVTGVLPVTVLTCSWSLETRLTPAAIGWAAKRLFACKQGRSLPASLLTTGRLPIGSHPETGIPALAASAPHLLMGPEPRLRNWCLPSARIA